MGPNLSLGGLDAVRLRYEITELLSCTDGYVADPMAVSLELSGNSHRCVIMAGFKFYNYAVISLSIARFEVI